MQDCISRIFWDQQNWLSLRKHIASRADALLPVGPKAQPCVSENQKLDQSIRWRPNGIEDGGSFVAGFDMTDTAACSDSAIRGDTHRPAVSSSSRKTNWDTPSLHFSTEILPNGLNSIYRLSSPLLKKDVRW